MKAKPPSRNPRFPVLVSGLPRASKSPRRRSRVGVATATLAVLAAVAFTSAPASADTAPKRSGGVVRGFFEKIGDLFRRSPRDPSLQAALDAYERGDYLSTYVLAGQIDVAKQPVLADEADLLKGLAAADAGLRVPAVASLGALLARTPVSPYYPLALGALLDLELRLGNNEAAADAAAKCLGDGWQRPRNEHDAEVKAVFLESGAISAGIHPRIERQLHSERDYRYRDRPAERAVYLAGIALLNAKQFEKASALLEALEPKSSYFSYARYAVGQAYYGLDRANDALQAFSEVQLPAKPAKDASERYLRDRALLSGAQLLHETDHDSTAIGWLRHIRREGPYGLHAALLAAQIQADGDEPALALVYLKDRPDSPGEPKLAARAAALDAELHRDIKDVDTAVSTLEQGLRGLDAYANRLTVVEAREGDIDALVRPLDDRQRRRDAFAAWRRQNVAAAVPELLKGRPRPNWVARLITRSIASDTKEAGYPVVYTPWPYDPFAELRPPDDLPFEPPADGAFPSVFRHSLAEALSDELHKENEIERALASSDDTHLGLLLLAGALELNGYAGGKSADDQVRDLGSILGVRSEVAARLGAADARRGDVLRVMKQMEPLERDAARHARLVALGRSQLALWHDYRRRLLAEAVRDERKAVDDLRVKLTFQLSQMLSEKKERENKLIEGS